MPKPGEVVHDVCGQGYTVLRELGPGGQGVAFEVLSAEGERCVAKVIYPRYATPEMERRLDALLALELSNRSPAICAPFVRLDPKHGLGTIALRAPGVVLDEVLETRDFDLLEAVVIGMGITLALAVLERASTSHGDISPRNIMVGESKGVAEVGLIDFDNAVMDLAPPPTFAGPVLYADPRLFLGQARTTRETDRYSLGVVMHELLLARHPHMVLCQQIDNPATYARMLLVEGAWPEDPEVCRVPHPPGHPQVGTLSQNLMALFRRALGPDPAQRPLPVEWARALHYALDHVHACPNCGSEFVNEASRVSCPSCMARAPVLELHVGTRCVSFDRNPTAVGRADIGGSANVSREHAVFHREGFELRVVCQSKNGLAVCRGGEWLECGSGEETCLAAGDRVRFAPGIEGVLRERVR